MKYKHFFSVFGIAFLFILVAVLMIGFMKNDRKNETPQYIPYFWSGELRVEKQEEKYVVTISRVGAKNKYIHFSEDRKVIKTKGVEPLKTENMQITVGMKMTDIIKQNGEPHADVGNGFYIPAYITENAYMYSLALDEKTDDVLWIIEEDLLEHKTE